MRRWLFSHVAVSDSWLLQHIDTFEDLTCDINHIRQAPVQESLAPYDPGQCLALKKFRFHGLDFLFNLEVSLQKDESAM